MVLKEGRAATKEELVEHIAPQFPTWWLPDQVEFLAEIPKTSVGKFDKKVIRARYWGGDQAAPSE